MNEDVRPAHRCERCGCESTSHLTNPDEGDDFHVCARCNYLLGSELTPLDESVRTLWASHDHGGSPRAEDIHRFEQMQHDPPETYEIREPTSEEVQEFCECYMRVQDALLDALPKPGGQPDPTGEPGMDHYDPGPDIYMP